MSEPEWVKRHEDLLERRLMRDIASEAAARGRGSELDALERIEALLVKIEARTRPYEAPKRGVVWICPSCLAARKVYATLTLGRLGAPRPCDYCHAETPAADLSAIWGVG